VDLAIRCSFGARGRGGLDPCSIITAVGSDGYARWIDVRQQEGSTTRSTSSPRTLADQSPRLLHPKYVEDSERSSQDRRDWQFNSVLRMHASYPEAHLDRKSMDTVVRNNQ
jgi:hypothetical protein